MLVAVFVLGHVDRNILNILIEPIKRELGASDTLMGVLTGPAFALFFAGAGVPIARLADRGSRTRIVLVGLVLWSIVTAAQGAVRALWHLVIARILVGVGEATTSPASHSLISDYYPPERRATALAAFTLSGHLGMMIGYVLGGFINDWAGWRAAFVIVGLPGLLLALLVAAKLREPVRGGIEGRSDSAGEGAHAFGEVFRYLWQRRSFRHINAAAPLYVATVFGFNVWGPTFLMRVHGMSTSEAGVLFGPVTGIAGVLGTLAAGALSDRWSVRDPRWSMRISAVGGLGMLPFAGGFLFAPRPAPALACFAVQAFLATFWMGPTYWAVQGLAKLRMRALAVAILLLGINVLGLAIGPLAIGVLNDVFAGRFGAQGIRYSLLIVSLAGPWAALHSLLAARALRADLAAARTRD